MSKTRLIVFVGVVSMLLVLIFFVVPAWHQTFTRKYGGTITVEIPAGFQATGATWGEDNLWTFVRNPTTGQSMLLENSRFGTLQGKVIYNEKAN